MCRFVTPALLLPGLLAVVGAHAYPDGTPPAHTGGHGQPDCGNCHFAAPAPSACSGLSLQGLPVAVQAGKRYTKYPNQRMFLVRSDEYAWLVPYVENDMEFFLKTIIPSRKATKQYLGR